MHDFVNNNIVRGKWKNRVRPILLNSWEAAYFNINEKKLLRLAKAGKEAGVELFVMDDGWFGERNDDTSSLGDQIHISTGNHLCENMKRNFPVALGRLRIKSKH